jgi:hypothetical protein
MTVHNNSREIRGNGSRVPETSGPGRAGGNWKRGGDGMSPLIIRGLAMESRAGAHDGVE